MSFTAIARQQAYHFQGGFGALDSFIAYVAAGAMDRLFERFAGEHAEQHRHARVQPGLHQPDAHRPIDVLVVRRLAANHRPQGEHGDVFAALGQPIGHQRNLERPGHPGHVDRRVAQRRLPRTSQSLRPAVSR